MGDPFKYGTREYAARFEQERRDAFRRQEQATQARHQATMQKLHNDRMAQHAEQRRSLFFDSKPFSSTKKASLFGGVDGPPVSGPLGNRAAGKSSANRNGLVIVATLSLVGCYYCGAPQNVLVGLAVIYIALALLVALLAAVVRHRAKLFKLVLVAGAIFIGLAWLGHH